MQNFRFHNPTEIIFGKGVENEAGKAVKKYAGKKVLLHYGQSSIFKTGLYDRIVKSLKDEGVEFVELGGVQPNPRLSLVKKGIELCKAEGVDFILAVGGGSVIDSAKAISVGVLYEGDVWDFYSYKTQPKAALGVGVVLTIPAAGSESSSSSVITNEDGWYKRGLTSELLRPRFALMNPELTFTLPAYQTACGVSDIMAHVMERYFTRERGVDFTDRLCEATLRSIIENVKIVLKEPENYDARAQIMWASTIAHNDLLGTGRIGDWGSHNIEHEISAIYDVAHGAGLAIVFPAWIKYVYKHDINRFAQFANRVWDVEANFDNLEAMVLEGVHRMEEFFKSIGLPVRLSDINVDDSRIDEMATKATEKGPLGQFVKLYKEDVANILRLAL